MNVRKQFELEIMGASSQYPIDLAHDDDGPAVTHRLTVTVGTIRFGPGPRMTVSDSVSGPSDNRISRHGPCKVTRTVRPSPSKDPARGTVTAA